MHDAQFGRQWSNVHHGYTAQIRNPCDWPNIDMKNAANLPLNSMTWNDLWKLKTISRQQAWVLCIGFQHWKRFVLCNVTSVFIVILITFPLVTLSIKLLCSFFFGRAREGGWCPSVALARLVKTFFAVSCRWSVRRCRGHRRGEKVIDLILHCNLSRHLPRIVLPVLRIVLCDFRILPHCTFRWVRGRTGSHQLRVTGDYAR